MLSDPCNHKGNESHLEQFGHTTTNAIILKENPCRSARWNSGWNHTVRFTSHATPASRKSSQRQLFLIFTTDKKKSAILDLELLLACQTSTGDELSEEAVHLAAGMLAARCQSVVVSSRSIKNQGAPVVAESLRRSYGKIPWYFSFECGLWIKLVPTACTLLWKYYFILGNTLFQRHYDIDIWGW